jgi:hypothetical protein
VLVTGSQGWEWPEVVTGELDRQRARMLCPDETLMVIHGGARRGADAFAHQWAVHHRDHPVDTLAFVNELVFPADWYADCRPTCKPDHRKTRPGEARSYCVAAGQYRNAEMVAAAAELGVYVGLAFSLNDSPGTEKCIALCRKRRINMSVKFAYSKAA